MVLEYLPTFAPFETPSFVGKYSSTIEHMGNGYSAMKHLSMKTSWNYPWNSQWNILELAMEAAKKIIYGV